MFLSLLMNIAIFSQQTDTLQTVRVDTLQTVQTVQIAQIAQENQDESVFKGRFSDSIDEIWELRESYKRGTFSLRAYRPNYIILSRYSTNPNRQPIGLNMNRAIPEYKNYQNIEAKFQVSLKVKVLQSLASHVLKWVMVLRKLPMILNQK